MLQEETMHGEEIQGSPCTWQPPPPRVRRRPRANAVHGRNGTSCYIQPHQPTDISQGIVGEITIPHVELPQDVLQHIYSMLPMRDAARAACVSHRFLRFWRCYPNLTFNPETLAANRQSSLRWTEDRSKYVFKKTQQVLENHSGTGMKTLRLNLSTCCKEDIDTSLLEEWLQAFVKPGLVDLTVMLPDHSSANDEYNYNFPYSILSYDDEAGRTSSAISSLQSLYLTSCGFHPTNEGPSLQLGCSRSLSKVCLRKVGVTGEELGLFLSCCFVLERLDLCKCDVITSMKIPRVLQKLSIVRVQMCRSMQMIENDATNLSTIHYEGRPLSRFSLGDSLQSKELDMHATRMEGMIQYAGSNLPSIAPNLEKLVLSTSHEKLKAPPVMFDKFQSLKHLVVCLGEAGGFCTGYDFVSLACFLDACPALEIFVLRIADGFAWYKKYVIVGKPDEEEDSSRPQQQEVPELRHGGLGNLRTATITGFCSAKSLLDLTCHILDTASPSLQCLTLDASPGYDRKRSAADRCCPMRVDALRDAEVALAAVRTHVAPKVPAGVELMLLGPCSRCHANREFRAGFSSVRQTTASPWLSSCQEASHGRNVMESV